MDKGGMTSGEWRMTNGEWRMTSDKWSRSSFCAANVHRSAKNYSYASIAYVNSLITSHLSLAPQPHP